MKLSLNSNKILITAFSLISLILIVGCDKSISNKDTQLTYESSSWDGDTLNLVLGTNDMFTKFNYYKFKLICPNGDIINPRDVKDVLSVAEGSDKVTYEISLSFTSPSCNKFNLELPGLGIMRDIEVIKPN